MWSRAMMLAVLCATPPTAALDDDTGWRLLQQTVACDDADINESGNVDVADLLLTLGAFSSTCQTGAAGGCIGDVNADGRVDVADLLLLLGLFGRLCEPAPQPASSAAADACGCGEGEGWSSSANACTDGGHTSTVEATSCSRSRPPPTAEQACDRLLSEGLDCNACLADLQWGELDLTPWENIPSLSACQPAWGAADDRAAERAALFPRGVRSLYNETDWLVRRFIQPAQSHPCIFAAE